MYYENNDPNFSEGHTVTSEISTQPVEVSYDEMRAEALKISPRALVRQARYSNTWEIYIPTNLTSPTDLPEKYRDTPAWALFESTDSSYGNNLVRWGYKNYGEDFPIEQIADRYNLNQKTYAAARVLFDVLNEESGLLPESEVDWDLVSNSVFNMYEKNRKVVNNTDIPEITEAEEDYRKKWSL